MNHQQRAFRRKIIYIAAIGLLLLPLYALGKPATTSSSNSNRGGSPGGQLAKMRTDNDLAQSNLGEIDPASETMKLATLGLRGVAANLLWTQANEYKMKKNWDKLSMTLNQIIKIQPNFMSVWEFQAHNLSYNVSAEFDDYQYRYHWVKKGLYFLLSGIAYNKRDYRILTNLGRFFGLKLGRSDERRQFRRMFRKDTDFHEALSSEIDLDETNGPEGTDNWLVSNRWFVRAENMVLRDPNVKVGGRAELMFFKDAPGALRNYARDLEEEFEPDEQARRAWSDAYEAWRAFGNRQIRTSIGTLLVLNDMDRVLERIDELQAELDALVPGVREEIKAEKIASLTPEEYSAFKKLSLTDEENDAIENDPNLTPSEKRREKRRRMSIADWSLTANERMLANDASSKVNVTEAEILERASEGNRDTAHRIYLQLLDTIEKLQWIQNYQNQVNYKYWEVRALAESQQEAIDARRLMFLGRRLEADTILDEYPKVDEITGLQVINPETGEPVMEPGARQYYRDSLDLWGDIYRQYPDLVDSVESGVMIGAITRYYRILEDLDEDWPLDFKLQFLIDRSAEAGETDLPTSEDVELLRLKQIDTDDQDGDDQNGGNDSGNDDASGDDASGDDATGDDATADDATADDATGDDATGDDDSGDATLSNDGSTNAGSGDDTSDDNQ